MSRCCVFSGCLDHVRRLGHRSAARRQPRHRRNAVRFHAWSRSAANPPVTTCGLPVAVSGRFDAGAHEADVLVVVAGFGTQG